MCNMYCSNVQLDADNRCKFAGTHLWNQRTQHTLTARTVYELACPPAEDCPA